ncbi:MAG: hypothetical protein RLZZ142_2680, partial [Verrucomicrobiota bacterium]
MKISRFQSAVGFWLRAPGSRTASPAPPRLSGLLLPFLAALLAPGILPTRA